MGYGVITLPLLKYTVCLHGGKPGGHILYMGYLF